MRPRWPFWVFCHGPGRAQDVARVTAWLRRSERQRLVPAAGAGKGRQQRNLEDLRNLEAVAVEGGPRPTRGGRIPKMRPVVDGRAGRCESRSFRPKPGQPPTPAAARRIRVVAVGGSAALPPGGGGDPDKAQSHPFIREAHAPTRHPHGLPPDATARSPRKAPVARPPAFEADLHKQCNVRRTMLQPARQFRDLAIRYVKHTAYYQASLTIAAITLLR